MCVGDINFTDAQEKRGGGTVAFQCDPLWNSLSRVLTAKAPAAGATVAAQPPPASKPAPQRALRIVAAPGPAAKPAPEYRGEPLKAVTAVKQLATKLKAKVAKNATRKPGSQSRFQPVGHALLDVLGERSYSPDTPDGSPS